MQPSLQWLMLTAHPVYIQTYLQTFCFAFVDAVSSAVVDTGTVHPVLVRTRAVVSRGSDPSAIDAGAHFKSIPIISQYIPMAMATMPMTNPNSNLTPNTNHSNTNLPNANVDGV